MTEDCEMYKEDEARKVYPSDEIRSDLSKERGYIIGEELVLCPIGFGECPYQKEATDGEGEILRILDPEDFTPKAICTSNGLVEKAGRITIKEIFEDKEPVNDNPEPTRLS